MGARSSAPYIHYRRWVKLYEAGQLECELDRLTVPTERKDILLDLGILKVDTHPGDVIDEALKHTKTQ